jgi:hypothetical protein
MKNISTIVAHFYIACIQLVSLIHRQTEVCFLTLSYITSYHVKFITENLSYRMYKQRIVDIRTCVI